MLQKLYLALLASAMLMTENNIQDTLEYERETTDVVYMCAVGDNLIHSPIYNKAKQPDGTYDFSKMYENISETIKMYDLAVINQETMYVTDESKISSYPCFGTPVSMGDYITDAGFNVVLGATNHSWDKSEYGVDTMLSYWSENPDVTLLGLNASQEEQDTIDIVEKNNIKFAMFNYTYGLNGFTLPKDKPYKVNLLSNQDKFLEDVSTAEDLADFTICFLHIGNEYVYEPTKYQVDYVDSLIDAGADVVICAHPHVVEPYGERVTANGNSGIVFYSLGNFISGQNKVPRLLGGMATLSFCKQDGKTWISHYFMRPLVTHYNSTEHTVYLLDDYTNELAKNHRLSFTVEGMQELWDSIMSKGVN